MCNDSPLYLLHLTWDATTLPLQRCDSLCPLRQASNQKQDFETRGSKKRLHVHNATYFLILDQGSLHKLSFPFVIATALLLPFLGIGKAVEQMCSWGKEICLEVLGFLSPSWEKAAHFVASTGTENQNKLVYSLWSSFPLLQSQNCVTSYHQTNK